MTAFDPRMPRLLRVPIALTVLLAAAPAAAEVCAVDRNPGATVLLPYFEVDLQSGASGETTLFELINALPHDVVARVTLWTDLGVPTFAFDVFLTGYDLQSFNLRDLFAGVAPVTGRGVSPVGLLSHRGPATGCDVELAADLPVAHLRAAHTGAPVASYGNLCAGRSFEDGRVRGYVTADVVGECGSELFPSDPGYFGPEGLARPDNALWGNYFYVDPFDDFAQGEALVRLEADPERFGPGDATFYGRYVGFDGSDAREPLPSAWALRSLIGFTGGPVTDWVTWRETPGAPEPFRCGEAPSWYPLPVTQLVNFDEEEDGVDFREVAAALPIPPPAPAAAQRDRSLPTFEPVGWIYADLGFTPEVAAQAYVAALITHEGRYSVGSAATPLDSGCGPRHCEVVPGGACPARP